MVRAHKSGGSLFKGLKVLVIDDSKTIRRTAETLLAKEGCEVFTAVDEAQTRWSRLPTISLDIVFVDIMMPRLDGYPDLRAHPTLQGSCLSFHSRDHAVVRKDGLFDRARQGAIVGSEHYLTKPFTKDELLGAIESHIGR